jgi:hypothetical protein
MENTPMNLPRFSFKLNKAMGQIDRMIATDPSDIGQERRGLLEIVDTIAFSSDTTDPDSVIALKKLEMGLL